MLYDIRHTKFNNQIITGIKINLSDGLIGFNCQPGYYVSLKDEFVKNFISPKIKILVMFKKRGYLLRIFWKMIYKSDSIIDTKTKIIVTKA